MTQLEPPNPNSESQTLPPDPDPEMKSPRNRTAITFARKKRKGWNPKAAQKKLEILRQTLNPIPFVPAKTLDFHRHRDLLNRLGLWDFAQIKFDRSIRADLLAQLIVNFSSQQRCSYVNDRRILVSRSEMRRALKLPVMVKPKKGGEEKAAAETETEESIVFLQDLVSNWVLLHEDMWMMPAEVLEYTKAIREGQFGKVDWADLIWLMVNDELIKGIKLENCYYASHLQHLMKCQREDLFLVKPEAKVEIDLKDDEDEEEEEEDVKMEDVEVDVELCLGQENVAKIEVEENVAQEENVENVEVVEEENAENVAVVEGENVENVGAVEGEDVEKCDVGEEKVEAEEENAEKVEAEEENAEKVEAEEENGEKVEAEQENGEKVGGETEHVEVEVEVADEDEDVMDFEFKEGESAQWVLAGKDNRSGPCLQQCNLGVLKEFGCEDERNKGMELGEGVGEEEQEEDEIEEEEEEEEDDDQEGGFHLLHKGFSMEGFPSGNLTQGMDGMPLRDHFGLEFPSPRDLMLPGSSSLYGNGPKREISHENENSHHGLNGNKRLRTDGSWNNKMSDDFETGMDQIQEWMGKVMDMQQWMGKARIMYAEKEHECQQASTNHQFFMQELQKRDELIDHLHKARFEDQQKLQTERFRFEHEIGLMKNCLDGYRKALKTTQKSFAEYRALRPVPVEPLYKDVLGSGGLVLSTIELEKLHIKQEEEDRMNRLAIEMMIKEFEAGWISEYEAHHRSVELASSRLVDIEKEVKLLKEGLLKQKLPEAQESAPNES